METGKLRAYFFNNMYFSGIHAGIQSQHTTAEMFTKYNRDACQYDMLFDWADNHKTTVVLNGGIQTDLMELQAIFSSKDNPYPWAYFNESKEAANGCLTNVGIIVPEKVYNMDKHFGQDISSFSILGDFTTEYDLEVFDVELHMQIKCKRLFT